MLQDLQRDISVSALVGLDQAAAALEGQHHQGGQQEHGDAGMFARKGGNIHAGHCMPKRGVKASPMAFGARLHA